MARKVSCIELRDPLKNGQAAGRRRLTVPGFAGRVDPASRVGGARRSTDGAGAGPGMAVVGVVQVAGVAYEVELDLLLPHQIGRVISDRAVTVVGEIGSRTCLHHTVIDGAVGRR